MALPRIVAASAVAVAALGLIGVGTGAQYTDATTSTQHITAGMLDVALTSSAAGSRVDDAGKNLTLGAWGPTDATFTTGVQPVTFTNTGTVAATRVVISATSAEQTDGTSAALAQQICVHLTAAGTTVYDGPLRSLRAAALSRTFPARTSVSATVELYAGSGACPALTARAMGGSISPRFTATFSG